MNILTSLITQRSYAQKGYVRLCLTVFLALVLQAEVGKSAHLSGDSDGVPGQVTDFKACAMISLKQTPQLQRTRIEIDIRHLDVEDSRWGYSPNLTLSSNYYFSEDDATLSFNVSNYKPWEPYFSVEANKLITQIAVLYHIQATSQALYKIADTILDIIALDKVDANYKQIDQLANRRLAYATQRQNSIETAPIELEIEQRTRDLAEAELQGNTTRKNMLLQGLGINLNLTDSHLINFDVSRTLEQILGVPDRQPDLLHRPEQSFQQKIMSIKLELQKKKITLAYSKYFPSFSFGVRSPDIINVSADEEQDYFLFAGMSLTLWDGKKRSRDITRQKMLFQQMQYEQKEVENKSSIEWLKAVQEYQRTRQEYKLTQAAEKLAMLKIKKKQLDYDRGSTDLPDLINHKISLQRDQIRTIWKELEFNKARLQLRHLSDRLLNDTVNISLPDRENE